MNGLFWTFLWLIGTTWVADAPVERAQTAPLWFVNGEGTLQRRADGGEWTRLSPQQSFYVVLSGEDRVLTVRRREEQMLFPHLSYSQDGRLFRDLQGRVLPEAMDQLQVTIPGRGLLRLRHWGDDEISVQVLRMRRFPDTPLWPLRGLQHDGRRVLVHFPGEARWVSHILLLPGQVLRCEPGQGLEAAWLETRLLFEGTDSAARRAYQVSWRQGAAQGRFSFESEPFAVVVAEERTVLTGRTRRTTLALSGQETPLLLQSDTPLLVRIAAGPNAFWLAGPAGQVDPESEALPDGVFPLRVPFLPGAFGHAAAPPADFSDGTRFWLSGPREAGLMWRDWLAAWRNADGSARYTHTQVHRLSADQVAYKPLGSFGGRGSRCQSFAFVTPQLLMPEAEAPMTTPRLLARAHDVVQRDLFMQIRADAPLNVDVPELPGAPQVRLRLVAPADETPLRLLLIGDNHLLQPIEYVPQAGVWQAPPLLPAARRYLSASDEVVAWPTPHQVEVAEIELPLPPGCRRFAVKLQQGTTAWVALDVRQSLPPRLPPQALLEMRAASSRPGLAAFHELVLGRVPAALARPADSEVYLRLHFEALARLLRTRALTYRGDPDCARNTPVPVTATTAAEREAMWRQAEALVGVGAATAALSFYGALAERDGDEEARLQRGILLFSLGETYLAEQDMRDLLWRSCDGVIRHDVYHLLRDWYRAGGDETGLAGLEAAMFWLEGTEAALAESAATLVQAGLVREAFDALSLLSRPNPTALVVTAAATDWPSDVALPGALSGATRWQALLAGLQHGAAGDRVAARAAFAEAGMVAQPFADAYERGLRVAAALTADARAQRLQAYFDLEDWWAELPGPRGWMAAPDTQTAARARVQVRQRARDKTGVHTLVTAEDGAAWTFDGPLKVRFNVRPAHDPRVDPDFIDGEITFMHNGLPKREGYRDNTLSANLTVVGGYPAALGALIQREFVLGPGRHRLHLRGDRLLAVTVQIETPLVAVPPLPRPSAAFLQQVLDGQPAPVTGAAGEVRLVMADGTLQQRVLALNRSFGEAEGRPLSALEQARVALRCDSDPALDIPPAILTALCEAERETLLMQWGGRDDARLGDAGKQLRPEQQRALLLHRGLREEAVDLPVTSEAEALRVLTLLTAMPRTGAAADATYRRVQALVDAYPGSTALRRLAAPILRAYAWEPIAFFDRGESVQVLPGELMSPAWRARAALLVPDPASWLLLGQQQKELIFGHEQARPLLLKAALERPTPLWPVPVTLQIRWDDGPAQERMLQPDGDWASWRLDPPPGAKRLLIGLRDAPGNQLLRLQIYEQLAGQWRAVPKDAGETQMRVVSPGEPLEVVFYEPTLLRVARRLEAGDQFETHTLDSPPTRFVLESDAEPQFYRLWRMAKQTRPAPEPRRLSVPKWRVPDFPLAQAPPTAVDEMRVPVTPAAGDGRWSQFAEAALVQRELSDEDAENAARDRYFQVGYVWRRHFEERHLYNRSRVAIRLRDAVGDSLALEQTLLWRRPSFDLTLRLEAHLQFLDTVVLDGTVPVRRTFDDPYSTQARLTWHSRLLRRDQWFYRTEVSLFRQFLGIDILPPVVLDWDIYTDYRVDHQYGVQVGQLVRFQPFHDTRIDLDGFLASNETLGERPVDFYRVAVNWRQHFGRWESGLGLRVRHLSADADRERADDQWVIGFQVGYWYGRLDYRHHYAGLRLSFDPEDQATNMRLSWRFNLRSRGGVGDYLPRELNFRQLLLRR